MDLRVLNSTSLVYICLFTAGSIHAQPADDTTPDDYSCSGQPVIDMHVHTPTAELIAEFKEAPPFLAALVNPTNEIPPSSVEDYLQQTLAIMDRCNVVRAFVTGSVERVEMWHQASPNRVIPSLDMGHFEDEQLPDLEQLRALYRDGVLRGLGELGPVYVGLSPSDPGYGPYYALAEEFDVPVAIHSGPPAPFQGADEFAEFGNPMLLEGMLDEYPGLRVNMMHGGIDWPDEARAIMEKYPQVYMDVAPLWIIWPGDEEAFREMADEFNLLYSQGLGDRVMFGTDNGPIPAAIDMSIEMIEANPFLSDERKRDILYNNAARFLRLSDEEISSDHGQ